MSNIKKLKNRAENIRKFHDYNDVAMNDLIDDLIFILTRLENSGSYNDSDFVGYTYNLDK